MFEVRYAAARSVAIVVLATAGLTLPLTAQQRALIPNSGDGTITVLSADSSVVETTLTVGPTPHGVAVHPTGSTAYVTNVGGNSLSVVDLGSSPSVASTVSLTGCNRPHGIVAASATKAYVACRNSNAVGIIDTTIPASPSLTGTIAVGTRPRDLALSSDGADLYVTNQNSADVSRIATATDTVVATIAVGNNPFGVAVRPSNDKVFVSNTNDDTISVISTATNLETTTIPTGRAPQGLDVSPFGDERLWVAIRNTGVVSVIDTVTDSIRFDIPVGAGTQPRDVSVDPDGSRAFVTNRGSGTVSVVSAVGLVHTTVAVGTNPEGLGALTTPPPVENVAAAIGDLAEPISVRCQNLTAGGGVTATAVPLQGIPAQAFDCEGSGLAISSGDRVRITVRGEYVPDLGLIGILAGITPSELRCKNQDTGAVASCRDVSGCLVPQEDLNCNTLGSELNANGIGFSGIAGDRVFIRLVGRKN